LGDEGRRCHPRRGAGEQQARAGKCFDHVIVYRSVRGFSAFS
jgi:hypothetical protein